MESVTIQRDKTRSEEENEEGDQNRRKKETSLLKVGFIEKEEGRERERRVGEQGRKKEGR
jgi:hypothetical protein